MTRILVIQAAAGIRENLLGLLFEEGFDAVGAVDGKAGVAMALTHPPAVIVCDIALPILDGHQVLRAIRDYPETAEVPFIFLSSGGEISDSLMSVGADDYLTLPVTRRTLLASIRLRLARHAVLSGPLRPELVSLTRAEDANIIVRSPSMQAAYERAMRAAQSNLSLLLLGETGVGKNVMAHAIHKASARAGKPFIPLNCAALPESLLESELFGHEKGAFTGAATGVGGLLEAAHGGTVFLDEVEDLPRATQAKLLRVLEDRRVVRVGGRAFHEVDVRIVAAANRDLEADCAEGIFRADLFYRIAGVVVTVPPLRERVEEIWPLAERFAGNMCRQLGIASVPQLPPETLQVLKAYDWPGNVRELRNAIEQAVALESGNSIQPEHLPTRVRTRGAVTSDRPKSRPVTRLKDNLRALERERILNALEQFAGNQSRAAASLGISRGTLIARLTEFEIARPRKLA